MTPADFADPDRLGAFFQSIVLALPRLLALFIIAPFFAGSVVTGIVRNGVVLVLALFVSPMTAGVAPPESLAHWIGIVLQEGVVGLLLGLGVGIFIWALQSVGDLIDFQTGSGSASFYDPTAGHENGPTGELLGWLGITLFMAGGGMVALATLVIESYRLWPVGQMLPHWGRLMHVFAVREGDTLFGWVVRLAAPVIAMLVLAEIGLGLLNRAAPKLNVTSFAQPLKSVLAVLMLLLALTFFHQALMDFLRVDHGLMQFLRSASGR